MQPDYNRDPRTVREILEDRRYAELEIDAVKRQIDKAYVSAIHIGSGWPSREKVPGSARYIDLEIDGAKVRAKVPGTEEWAVRPRGTNNQIGAALQHADGYTEALERVMLERQGLLELAERVLSCVPDTIDRTILRYYYCQAMNDAQIAEIMHFERRSICKRRNETVDDLEENWRKSTA